LTFDHVLLLVFTLAGVDYVDIPLNVRFNAGETAVTVTLAVVDDRIVDEIDESFNLTLLLPVETSNGVRVGNIRIARAIIHDSSKYRISYTNDLGTLTKFSFFSKTTNHLSPS